MSKPKVGGSELVTSPRLAMASGSTIPIAGGAEARRKSLVLSSPPPGVNTNGGASSGGSPAGAAAGNASAGKLFYERDSVSHSDHERYVVWFKAGIQFQKYGRSGKPHPTIVSPAFL